MRVALAIVDGRMARTVFYDQLVEAVKRNKRFAGIDVAADVVLPAEDVSLESNWPRYGRMQSAYLRGSFDAEKYRAYVKSFVGLGRTCCLVNADPTIRMPLLTQYAKHTIVADYNLSHQDRATNPRSIAMPALPIIAGRPDKRTRPIRASFRGIPSHPCRNELEQLHNGRDVVCQIVEPANHAGKLDATTGQLDAAYAELLASSVFAFVPRGDALFSYRLLEAMSFGCIPIVLADGWVLPFDTSIDWPTIALHPREANIAQIPEWIASLPANRVAQMQRDVASTYMQKLSSFDAIVESLFQEIELRLDQPGGAQSTRRAEDRTE